MSRRLPAVPPLSRPAWERVENGVLERLRRGEHLLLAHDAKPARHWLQVLPAVAMAFAVVLWWQREATRHESFAPLPAALPAAPPARRQTAHFETTSAPLHANLGEARMTLATHSEMSGVGSEDAGWHINVERGQIEFDVAPRAGRPPFVVQAGETLVTVVGTRFTVVRDGPRARVSVEHGRVQLDSGAHRGSLGAGEQWPAATSSPPPEPLPEVVTVTELPPQVEPRKPSRSRSGSERALQSFARATRLESKRPAAAIAIYRRLARGSGPWAANALYAEARLELERGREATARRRFALYLRSFPDGKNAADVRTILQRLSAEGRPE